jgi:hypothetical protein
MTGQASQRIFPFSATSTACFTMERSLPERVQVRLYTNEYPPTFPVCQAILLVEDASLTNESDQLNQIPAWRQCPEDCANDDGSR